MGRALVAALSGSVSVVVAGAVIGVVVVTSTPAPVSATEPSAAVASTAPVPAPSLTVVTGLDKRFAQGVAESLTQGVQALQNYAVAPQPTRQPAVFSTAAINAGLAATGYAFTAQIAGLADLSALGGSVVGTVTDADHFTLEFPASHTVTRYLRDGDTAFAWIGGRRLTLGAGPAAKFGTISPEDFLPARLWTAAVNQWADTLKPGTSPGDYIAPSGVLTAKARTSGYAAQDWTLKVHIDESGRLTTLGFAGTSFGAPFGLDVTVRYP